jgi:hypothetical protein
LQELQQYADIKEPELDDKTKARIHEFIARLEEE